MDLKDVYFHIQIAPHYRPFLGFALEVVAYHYTVLPFGLSLSPRTFKKSMDAAFSPLRQKGVHILSYLLLPQSEAELDAHRSLLLSQLECLGLRINDAKSSLSSIQRISSLGAVLDLAQR